MVWTCHQYDVTKQTAQNNGWNGKTEKKHKRAIPSKQWKYWDRRFFRIREKSIEELTEVIKIYKGEENG